MTTLEVINEDTRRAKLAADIAALKAQHDRLPKHFEAKRDEVMDQIHVLIDEWLHGS